DLARDVQRQIARIDDAAHEAQIRRQQLFRGVHDEDSTDVQLHAVTLIPVPEIEWRSPRDVKELRKLLPPLDPDMRPRKRRLEIVRHALVKLLVLFRRDV